jgi:hypothetical protein
MNPRSLCAIVLALALPALGQTEPQIEPLVPPGSVPAKCVGVQWRSSAPCSLAEGHTDSGDAAALEHGAPRQR